MFDAECREPVRRSLAAAKRQASPAPFLIPKLGIADQPPFQQLLKLSHARSLGT